MTSGTVSRVRRRVTVRGTVQGVGFRPFVHRLASGLALSGFVRNGAQGVVAEVEGTPEAVARFCELLRERPPPLADVREVAYEDVPAGAGAGEGFLIETTDTGTDTDSGPGGGPLIPPDTAACADCLRELADPADRRHRHPFVTCTYCGPRFTIATALPYDRASTTMAAFPLCRRCAAEYADPADRRFHAQPVACPDCGPTVRLTVGGRQEAAGGQALARARRLLARGAIVAVKGLGGYHLACDATDGRAVAALRARKERGGKPFAVMCADLATAERLAHVSAAERAVLTGRRAPVVLLRRREGAAWIDAQVCPGSPDVGVMLPYTPLHRLLFGLPGDPPGPRVLVMTSGNRSGEPIVTDDAEALTALAGIADAWLWHDRAVEGPCDDSVVRVRPDDGSEVVLRRSRGYVPEPVGLPFPVVPALAVGGDLKNALCLGAGDSAWFSPHIGDMGALETVRSFERAAARLSALTGVTPGLLAADRHPGYHSARWARRRAAVTGQPLRLVQHHHAHVAAVLAENGVSGTDPVIGVAFDGTGYGEDGAVWGGEVLLARGTDFRRFAHLRYVPLPGGNAAVANPCRTALAHLRAAGLPWDPALPCAAACAPGELRLLERQLDRGAACVPTSSMGRLFDAVASLTGVCHRAGYEAQAAIELEAAAARVWGREGGAYAFGTGRGAGAGTFGAAGPGPGPMPGPMPGPGPNPPYPPGESGPYLAYAPGSTDSVPGPGVVLDPGPVLAAIVGDLRRGVPVPVIAARFHRAVAVAVAAVCRAARAETGADTAALSGGVFGNALLDQECAALLAADGFTVLRHRRVPPGDGGLALGQLALTARAEP
ncbi:carbamoyltransferase HypF [Actinacidiphila acididurans]|uniref:Carbamoyltransferase n=1 Tax=Actinacidiphila acididurans TaxID=2784346 RepID=A0ABS2U522_9ACTN|nr:carbamoyltransferase HypF [Actinacidiphila acididurans]MBM9510256.1 carbamoyltransferase HypF [Actinacidiphila acididurans]